MGKLVTVFCVLLLAYSAQCAVTSSMVTEFTSALADTSALAQEKATEVMDVISTRIEDGTTAMSELAAAIDTLVNEYASAMAEATAETTTDLSACAKVTPEEVQAFGQSVQANATSCLSTLIETLETYDAEGKALLADFFTEVASINATVAECWTTYSSSSSYSLRALATLASCVAKAQMTMAGSFSTSFATTRSEFRTLLSEVSEASASMAKCGISAAISDMQAYIEALNTSYEECVAQLST